MATPEGSRCRWDQISRWVGVSPSGAKCTLGAGPLQGRCGGHVLCWQVGLMPPPPQHLQRALRLHPAAGPAALLPLAQCRPRRLLPAGPRRILHQLHGGQAPRAGWAAPRDGCGCGCGAWLPRAPGSRPHTQQSPERSSNPSRQLPSPCLPLHQRGASNSPLPSQPWEFMSGMSGLRVRGTGQSRDRGLGVPGDGAGPMAQGEAGPQALAACICPGGGERWEKGPRHRGPDPGWAEPFLGTLGWGLAGSAGDARLVGGALGLGWQPPSRPCPSCPCPSPPDAPGGGRLSRPWGRAEIIGCLPGRGFCRPTEGSSGSNKERDQGAPTLRPPECQGLMASRCGCLPAKGPAVPWSGGCRGPGRVGCLCQDICRGARNPVRLSFHSREGASELRFITLRFTLCVSCGRAIKGEALGLHSAPGQR